jgi:hypothetical protein
MSAPKPVEAIRFLRRKKVVPVENWDLIGGMEHAHAFTVSHITNAEALESIRELMVQAKEEGLPYDRFKKDMLSMMDAKGWYLHPDKHIDKEYRNWRVDVIYRTNMRTAHSAASYRQQLRSSELRPWWVYKQKQRPTKRAEHEPLHNLAKRYDDPFWDTYYPPNGWGCDCYVQTLSEHQHESGGYKKEVPPDFNPTTVPDEWRHNPGLETLAPDFSKFTNLAQFNIGNKSALGIIKDSYQDEVAELALSKGEWRKVSGRLLEQEIDLESGKLVFKHPVQNVQYYTGAMTADVAEALKTGEIKMMFSDRSIQHGNRPFKRDKVPGQILPASQIQNLPQWFSAPDMVFRELDGNYHFMKRYGGPTDRVRIPGEELAVRGVFRKTGISKAWQLVTYMIVPIQNDSTLELLYKK